MRRVLIGAAYSTRHSMDDADMNLVCKLIRTQTAAHRGGWAGYGLLRGEPGRANPAARPAVRAEAPDLACRRRSGLDPDGGHYATLSAGVRSVVR